MKNRILEEVRARDNLQLRLDEHIDRNERQTQSIKLSEKNVNELKKQLREVMLAKGISTEERESMQNILDDTKKIQ